MSNSLIDNLLANPLAEGITSNQLGLALLIVAAVLGYCAYADLFLGRIIPNPASVGLIIGSLAVVPLAAADVTNHLIVGAVVCVVLTLLCIVGVFAPGDWKVYCGLAILLGPASIVLIFVSFAFIIVYSLPIAIKTMKGRKLSVERPKAGHRLGTSPGAPGIALSFPATLALMGLDPIAAAALLGAMIASFALSRAGAILDQKSGLKEKNDEEKAQEDGSAKKKVKDKPRAA